MISAELLTSLKCVALFCVHICWALSILDSFSVLLNSLIHLFFSTWKYSCGYPPSKNATAKIMPAQEPCHEENVNTEMIMLCEAEVKMVMERLGIFCYADCGNIQEQVGMNEIATLFDEKEVSLEEVKEAFDVFDANNDGYIDAKELRKVICALGFVLVPERVCQSMISSYDDDGDGRVNFSEFVKLFEKSSL